MYQGGGAGQSSQHLPEGHAGGHLCASEQVRE